MHMRFDGFLGFPGGLCDAGENVLQGINRELEEEMGLDTSQHAIVAEDHMLTHVNHTTRLCLHFYSKEIPRDHLVALEAGMLQAPDYGSEVRSGAQFHN